MKKSHLITIIILLVLLIDQALKIYIKTNFELGEGIPILGQEWAKIHFVENDGMAFGLSFGGVIGKYILSVFRIILVCVLIYIIRGMIKAKESTGLLIAFALIIAGAIGNILDCAFYGMIFSSSPYHGPVAEIFPDGGGYAPFLRGKVVDMFYFPMYKGILPEWIPFRGGTTFSFFNPVFNVADTSISLGVFTILAFYRSFFKSNEEEQVIEEKVEIDNNQEE